MKTDKRKSAKNKKKQKNQPITMGRNELKAYLCKIIEYLDEESYLGFCDLFLRACGVLDSDGKLTKEYENSPYWTVKDGKLEASSLVSDLVKL